MRFRDAHENEFNTVRLPGLLALYSTHGSTDSICLGFVYPIEHFIG